eukprot:TRINITY_DN17805_c3_g1_i1.p1 TRINITY_DN17805_c3_g1~~TRINITY_DN17805_c3_g1_i1.p1  ORF type:complete len:527 (+),score=132.61 TRINITY_DN17805_c3_g1_i1:78-1658(+)
MQWTSRSAADVVQALRRGDVTPTQLLDALSAEGRFEAAGAVRALVPASIAPCMRIARAKAAALERRWGELCEEQKGNPAYLYGLPVTAKDLADLTGVPCSFGSKAFAGRVSPATAPLLSALERNGALIVAKTNTPEFGAGSHTFNSVVGTTCNPRAPGRSAGGSSGGAAAAVAVGCGWLAHGSDFGGSTRVPAAWCGVTGFRPSPPADHPVEELWSTDGAHARSVGDLALALDAMGFPASRSGAGPPNFAAALCSGSARAAGGWWGYTADFGGLAPFVSPEVAASCSRAASAAAAACGAQLRDSACPDGMAADCPRAWYPLRLRRFHEQYAALRGTPQWADLKPEVRWNVSAWDAVSPEAEAAARAAARRVAAAAERFFGGGCRLLMAPCTPCAPFPAALRYPWAIGPARFSDYMGWMALTWGSSCLRCPAACVPCGALADGSPVGLQLIGAPGADGELLALAAAVEGALGGAGPAVAAPSSGPPTGREACGADGVDGPLTEEEAEEHHRGSTMGQPYFTLARARL